MISEKHWQWQYAILNEQARKDPIEHLLDYCTQDSLFNQRQKLFEVFSLYFSSKEFKEYPGIDRSRLLWFYRVVQEILEASCRVRELVQEKKLTYTYLE